MQKYLHYDDASAYIDYAIIFFLIHIRYICATPPMIFDASTTTNHHKVTGFILYATNTA